MGQPATPTEHGLRYRLHHLMDSPQDPPLATRPAPTPAEALTSWVQLGGTTAVINLLVLAAALAMGASMRVDIGATIVSVDAVAVGVASLGAVGAAVALWSLAAHRVSAFAYLWTPLGWGVGLVSLGGVLGASDLSTGLTLAVMHVVATIVGTLMVPRRMPR